MADISWLDEPEPHNYPAAESYLSLLYDPVAVAHVEKDRGKIAAGRKLSPLLLVRGKANGRVVIADGYHRLCAVYSYDEDAAIPCTVV